MYDHGANIYAYKKKLLDYSSNINPLGIPDSFKEALIQGIYEFERYPDYRYHELKKALSSYLEVDSKDILVDNGSVELIHKVIQCGFHKVVTLAPTFSEYEKAAVKAGVPFEVIPLTKGIEGNHSYYDLDDEKLIERVEKETLVIICNPNNPTGNLLSKDRLENLIAHITKKGGYLLVDEAFIELSLNPQATLMKNYKQYKRLIISRAATKYFGLPGIRLGYMITSNERLLNKLAAGIGPWQVNTAAELAKVIFKDRDYMIRTNETISKEIPYCYRVLQKINGIKVYKSSTIFHLVELENDFDAYRLKENLIEAGYLIRTPDGFRDLSQQYFRIAVKGSTHNIQFLKVLEREVSK
ncbi:pyridoxal phosphate-dependent aminotransferase [Vallitalea okinawensis]|uniref:pyridoxal phosphate-dependent aminotransferase n=1 Tax=Vallitalea okinawensis TaxID=2078660 RepID=UPI000CFD7CAA|nr:aminotransferase class I/II-fold pyridoxal phosphate-dependent enzyme [Vallitalea okinawensis]